MDLQYKNTKELVSIKLRLDAMVVDEGIVNIRIKPKGAKNF